MGLLDPKPVSTTAIDGLVRDKINLAGSATKVALDATYASRAVVDRDSGYYSKFSGKTHIGYGNSYGNLQFSGQADAMFPDIVAGLHGVTAVNRWQNGAQMQDTAMDAIGHATRVWTPTQGLVIVGDPINDIGWRQGDTQALNGYKESLRALLHILRSGSRVESSTATFTGTWDALSATTADPWSGGELRYVAGAGVGTSATLTFTGTACALLTYGRVDGASANVNVYVDDVLYATKTLGNVGRDTNNNSARGYLPVVIPISGLSNASHTVKIEAATVGNIHIDALLVPAATPPTICILKAVKPTDAAYVSFYGAGKVDTHRAAFNAAIDEVVAEFPADGTIVVADANRGWDPIVHQSSDGLHPSTLGMKKEASAVAAALGDRQIYLPV